MPIKQIIDALTQGNMTIADTSTLSDQDIRRLVDYAIEHPTTVPADNHVVDILSVLLKDSSPKKHSRDVRIAAYLIEQAQKHYASRLQSTEPQETTAIFGMSGNPPTLNHVRFIQYLTTQFKHVRVILNAQSPLKKHHETMLPEDRLVALKLLLKDSNVDTSRYTLETLEIDRGPPSYMVATMSQLILRSSSSERFTLVMGLDSLFTFTRWHAWKDLTQLCTLTCYARPGETTTPQTLADALAPLLAEHMFITLAMPTFGTTAFAPFQVVLESLPGAKTNLTLTQATLPTTPGAATAIRKHYREGKETVPDGITPAVDKLIRDKGYFQ